MYFHLGTMAEDNRAELDFAAHLDFSRMLTNPILDIAARFWENERYEAFTVCYRSMRIIDDLVDNRKTAAGALSETEQQQYRRTISDWVDAVRRRRPRHPLQEMLIASMDRFRIPVWPWERLSLAMVYDLGHDGFPTFRAFLRYCEGAAIAPASVFMHLCGLLGKDGAYRRPSFDIRKASRPLAIFSYLVHIIRDFQVDQKNNLNYLARDLHDRHGLSRASLREIAQAGRVNEAFRNLMSQYRGFAEYYRRKARAMIDDVGPRMQPRYQLSLEIIYRLYLQILDRIDPQNGNFTEAELNPPPGEVQDRIAQTIAAFQPA